MHLKLATAPTSMIAAPAYPEFVRQPSAPARIVTTGVPVVTMRWNPRQYWFLAQFFQFQTPSELRDGLKSGAFKVRLSLAQGRASTDTHSGALPFHWTAIKTMIQSYQVPILGEQRN